MKQLSKYYADNPPKADAVNPVATDLGLARSEPLPDALSSASTDRYKDLIFAVYKLFGAKSDPAEYEDKCRALFGTSAYLVFTLDKVVMALIKQIQTIQMDSRSHDLVGLYFKDRERVTTSSRQEAVYRLNAEGLSPEEVMYRLEYFLGEKVLTMQLLGKEDPISDGAVSTEERWSMYVDNYIQLSSTQGLRLNRPAEPFLRRNLPDMTKAVPEDVSSGVELRSGLELKICLNTYKIFFVENTEDYYARRSGRAESVLTPEGREKAAAYRRRKWLAWLEKGPGVAREQEGVAAVAVAAAGASKMEVEEAKKAEKELSGESGVGVEGEATGEKGLKDVAGGDAEGDAEMVDGEVVASGVTVAPTSVVKEGSVAPVDGVEAPVAVKGEDAADGMEVD
ncbi:Transcriptional regulatory protein sin3 [Blyttiomyces sp. JEL0837]|nr:Transcriptional regulatory protein sin3 [Blyttiomyces sp. JEL0837]